MINEILFILVMLVSFIFVLAAVRFGKDWLIVIPPVFLVFANIFAPQFINAFGLTTSLAVPIYAAIFLATDIIAEHWGKKEARKVIWIGFFAQIALVIVTQILLRAEVLEISQAVDEAMAVIFGFTPRIVLGSLVAYIISQNWDIWVFHSLKSKTKGKHLWLRNNASTMTSQFIDSTIFIFIAFYGVLPAIWQLVFSVWILKVLVAAFDTPIVYLSYTILGKKRPKNKEHHHAVSP
jgi:queuosine precursor transporter